MKRIFFVVFCLMAAGCMVVSEQEGLHKVVELPPGMTTPFISLRQVYKGMTRGEVKAVIGDKVPIGYELSSLESQYYKPVTQENPFRSETYKKDSSSYDIDYYLLGIVAADNQVTDDELMPMVFYKDKLVGYGWDYLSKQIKNE